MSQFSERGYPLHGDRDEEVGRPISVGLPLLSAWVWLDLLERGCLHPRLPLIAILVGPPPSISQILASASVGGYTIRPV